MTSAGATYPYGHDPLDSNIRVAPSLPPVEELQQASGVGSSIIDRLRQVGALGDLPESSQVSFF